MGMNLRPRRILTMVFLCCSMSVALQLAYDVEYERTVQCF